jgi:hypothetical protein
VVVTTHPELNVLVITVEPADSAVTRPVEEPIVAIAGALLLQVPVPPVFDKVVVEPVQSVEGPLIEGINAVVLASGLQQPAAD